MATSLVLLSGGLDSATALAVLVQRGGICEALFVSYGQPAADDELEAAAAISTHYGACLKTIRLNGLRFGSGEIRGRNAFLIHTALLAAPSGPSTIVTAIHAGSAYADCSPEFISLMQGSLAFHSAGEVTLAAPFADCTKADIYRLARELVVPVELTYSCECGGVPCGTCLSCKDREGLRAFA